MVGKNDRREFETALLRAIGILRFKPVTARRSRKLGCGKCDAGMGDAQALVNATVGVEQQPKPDVRREVRRIIALFIASLVNCNDNLDSGFVSVQSGLGQAQV